MFNSYPSAADNSSTPKDEIGKSINPNFYFLLHNISTEQEQLRLFGAMSFHLKRTGSLNISVSDDSLDESLYLFDLEEKEKEKEKLKVKIKP